MRISKTGFYIVIILWLLWGTIWPGHGPSANKARAEKPTIWYVKADALGDGTGKDWENAFATLQDALEAAKEGHEIWIAAGTYFPEKLFDPYDKRSAHFQMKKNVAIYGGFAGYETILEERDIENNPTILSGYLGAEVGNAYHVFYHEDLDLTGAILDGVTITGGNADGIWPHDSGGGMYNENSSPTLRNVKITGNYASSSGGGIYNASSKPTLEHVTITFNHAGEDGGGMYNTISSPTLIDVEINNNFATNYGGGMFNNFLSSPKLTDVTITGNGADYGGGMANFLASPTLTDVTITVNSAIYGGGGMFNTFSSPTLTNVTITGNHADEGGGIYNEVSGPTLTNGTIADNSAHTNGGGMYNSGGSPKLTDVTITGNDADYGGGMYNSGHSSKPALTNVTITGNLANTSGGGMYNDNSSPTLTNVTITGNSAGNNGSSTGYGGGIYNFGSSNPILTNVTIAGNRAEIGGGGIYIASGTSVIRNSIIYGNANDDLTDLTGSVTWSPDHNIIGLDDPNPLFMDPKDAGSAPTTEGNYRLRKDSPAINAGDKSVYDEDQPPDLPDLSGITTDVDGNPRIVGDNVDLGAYEHPFALVSPTLKAVSGDRQVTLTWNAIPGAEEYKVYRYKGESAPADPADWDMAASVTDTTHTVTGLTNGQPYTFAVQAHSLYGTSDYSNPVTAVPRRMKSGESSGTPVGGTPVCGTRTSTNGQLTLPPCWSGEVSLGDAITVIIPAGAADQELAVTIREVQDPRQLPAEQGQLISPVFEIAKNIPGTLGQPVTLTLKFDPSGLKDHQVSAVFFYDEAKKAWVELPGAAIEENRITVTVDTFGRFAVFAVESEPEAPAPEFLDMAGHWAEEAVRQAVAKGIITGYPDGTFRPDLLGGGGDRPCRGGGHCAGIRGWQLPAG